ncbi:MAG: thioredoxin family protein [Bdellovibrionaceae bacterium]|nr:thioredoxin family protein [Pseudobdellovibrionaceae bacterium]
MRTFPLLVLGFVALLNPPGAGAAPQVKAPHVEVSLLSADRVMARGEKSWWGVAFKLDPHWHIYWKNPGDSGAAPKFTLNVEGGTAGEPQWPVPQRLPLGEMVNFGYEGEVIYPFEVTAGARDRVKVRAKLEWLVCHEECVPGFATLDLEREIKDQKISDPLLENAFAATLRRVPSSMSPGRLSGRFLSPTSYELTFEPAGAMDPSSWLVFPVDGEKFNPREPEKKIQGPRITWIFRTVAAAPDKTPYFLLANEQAAHEVTLTAADESPLGLLLFFAFLGGMILNLMPCVFPVLSIKVFSLMKESGGGRAALAREGILYTSGVLVTFLVLGAVFLLLREGGEAIGWGFQLQSPVVVFFLMLLFFALALNFLGVFEWGTALMNWAGMRSTTSKGASAFGTGVLSVFVAAPCTGPFMGAALGAAATLPAVPAMSLFLALALGLAAPVLALCLLPGGLKMLPKPGAWMETLKEFFAFPLFATVLWLWWVLVQQVGAAAVISAGGGLLLLAWALWIRGPGWRKGARVLLILIAVLGPAMMLRPSVPAESGAPAAPKTWVDYDESALAAARAENRAVFIDFTAAWCITCQWNKKAVLQTAAAEELFRRNNVLLMQGDWTRYDEKITKALAAFGRASVPLYVYYPAGGGEPRLLPQMLTMSMIEELFQPTTGGQQ